jgi:hypothetical protein
MFLPNALQNVNVLTLGFHFAFYLSKLQVPSDYEENEEAYRG